MDFRVWICHSRSWTLGRFFRLSTSPLCCLLRATVTRILQDGYTSQIAGTSQKWVSFSLASLEKGFPALRPVLFTWTPAQDTGRSDSLKQFWGTCCNSSWKGSPVSNHSFSVTLEPNLWQCSSSKTTRFRESRENTTHQALPWAPSVAVLPRHRWDGEKEKAESAGSAPR